MKKRISLFLLLFIIFQTSVKAQKRFEIEESPIEVVFTTIDTLTPDSGELIYLSERNYKKNVVEAGFIPSVFMIITL